MKRLTIVLSLFFTPILFAQSATKDKASTSGNFSPNINGNGITVIYNFYGRPIRVTREERLKILKDNASALANEVVDFVYAREGPVNSWTSQAMAQSFTDAIKGRNQEVGASQFRQRKMMWDEQTKREFKDYYWPRIASLNQSLARAGIKELSPISHAVATDDPREIGYMLSVVADRIGKTPPFERTLTELEAKSIFRGTGPAIMEIYAYQSDVNSVNIAHTIHDVLAKQGWKVNDQILPLEESATRLQGIVLIYPSYDWTTIMDSMLTGFEKCNLEIHSKVVQAVQPPTIFKIEIWPEGTGPTPKPSLLRP